MCFERPLELHMKALAETVSPATRMAIETRSMTRTVRRLRRLSVVCIENTSLVADLTMPSLSEIFSFCDEATKATIHDSCAYFAKLIDTSRQELEVYTEDEDWLELLRVSPYLKRLTIHGELSAEDTLAINSLIKFNCLPDLSLLYLDEVGEVAIIDILNAIELKLAYLKSKENTFTVDGLGNKTLGLRIDTPSMRKLTARSIASALNGSIHEVLTQFSICTRDGAGLVELFKNLELYQFKNLHEISISQCNMCRKSFEMFVRSLWPEFVDSLAFVPITKLRLEDCGLNDNCIDSLVHALNRGAGVNIEVLDLSSNRITRNGIKALAQPFQNYQLPNLTCFYLSNNWSGNGGVAHILDVLKDGASPNLQELEIDRMGLGVRDMNSLNEYILSPFFAKMYRLNLRNNPEMMKNVGAFFDNLIASTNRTLSILFLENTGLGDAELSRLVRWFNSGCAQELKYLFLKGNSITGLGFKKLLDCLIKPNTPNLKVLDVASNAISNIFIETNDYIDQLEVIPKSSSYDLNKSFEQITHSSSLGSSYMETIAAETLSSSSLNDPTKLTSPSHLKAINIEAYPSGQYLHGRASLAMDVIDSDDSGDSEEHPEPLVTHSQDASTIDEESVTTSERTPASISPLPPITLDENAVSTVIPLNTGSASTTPMSDLHAASTTPIVQLSEEEDSYKNELSESDDENETSCSISENEENEMDQVGAPLRESFHEHVGSPQQPIHQFSGEFYHTSHRVKKSTNINTHKNVVGSLTSEGKSSASTSSIASTEYRKNWNLIQLEVSYNPFTDRDIIGLFDILKKHCNLECLEDLGFDEGKFTSLGFQTIFESLTLDMEGALNRIDIFSGCGSGSGRAIRQFLESRFADHLNILQLRDCHLTKQDCYDVLGCFETERRPKNLKKLFLTGNPEFGDEHLEYLVRLLKEDKLSSSFVGLNASYTCVSEEGLEILYDYYSTYPETNLRKIILEGMQLSSRERRKYEQRFEKETNCQLLL